VSHGAVRSPGNIGRVTQVVDSGRQRGV